VKLSRRTGQLAWAGVRFPVVLLLPLALLAALVGLLAALVGLCERLLGTLARVLVRPVIWAVERDGGVKREEPPARLPDHVTRTR
jgi:hypothetical protein